MKLALGYVLYRKLIELGIEALVAPRSDWKQAASERITKLTPVNWLGGFTLSWWGSIGLTDCAGTQPNRNDCGFAVANKINWCARATPLEREGRSPMLTQGYGTKGSWWRPRSLYNLRAFLPEWIRQELALWQTNLLLLDQQIAQLKAELAQSLQGPRPKGAGALSLTQLDQEVFDWHRFANPRNVGCFGDCPTNVQPGIPLNSVWVQSPKSGRLESGCCWSKWLGAWSGSSPSINRSRNGTRR